MEVAVRTSSFLCESAKKTAAVRGFFIKLTFTALFYERANCLCIFHRVIYRQSLYEQSLIIEYP